MVARLTTIVKKIQDKADIITVLSPGQLDIHLASEHPKLVVIDQGMFEEFKDKLKEHNFEQTVVIGEATEENYHNTIFINDKHLTANLIILIDDFVQNNLNNKEYIPILAGSIKYETIYPCEFYLKINTDKFLKINNTNEPLDEERVQKYLDKGTEFLFIKKESYSAFADIQFQREVNTSLESPDNDQVSAIAALHNFTKDLGFSTRVVEMTREIHNDLEEKFKNDKTVKSLFDMINNIEGSELHQHSFLTSVVALETANEFSWITKEIRESLYIGSILHDMGYQNIENGKYEGYSTSQLNDLSKDIRDDVLNHTTRFKEDLEHNNEISQDAINMILNHHGVFKESAYPSLTNPASVSLVFALFAMAHEFTILFKEANFDKFKATQIIDELEAKFEFGNYRKVNKGVCERLKKVLT